MARVVLAFVAAVGGVMGPQRAGPSVGLPRPAAGWKKRVLDPTHSVGVCAWGFHRWLLTSCVVDLLLEVSLPPHRPIWILDLPEYHPV